MHEERNFFTDGAAYERLMGRWSVPVGEVFLGTTEGFIARTAYG
jgi:hypothetical protein